MSTQLLEKGRIKNTILKNKFVKASSWEALATGDGKMTKELFDVYKELADGEVGLIETGYAYVNEFEKPNPGMMGIYDDSFIEEYKELTSYAHRKGSKIVLQIVYGGSMTTLDPVSEVILGASSVENERTKVTPLEITKDEIEKMVQLFADAAKRAEKADFDGIEVHSGHGYFLSSFLTPYYNQRTDEYGGSIENRSRIHKEIIEKIRSTVSDDFLVGIKINSEDFMENGLTKQDSITVVKRLEEVGLDYVEVTGGNESSPFVLNNNLGPARRKLSSFDHQSYFKEYAFKLKKEVKIPVVLTGGNRNLDYLNTLIEESKIDFVGIARPMISEPDLVKKYMENPDYQMRCVSCNGCYHTKGKRCVLNLRQRTDN